MVEKDQVVRASIKPPVCLDFVNYKYTTRYNLDIIDEVIGTDGTYEPYNYGAGVDIYILDTGVNYDHEDFRYFLRILFKIQHTCQLSPDKSLDTCQVFPEHWLIYLGTFIEDSKV